MFSFRLQDLLSSKPVFIYNQYTIKSLLKRTLRILLSRNPVQQKLISVPYKVRVKVGDIFTAQYFNTRQAASEREPLPGGKISKHSGIQMRIGTELQTLCENLTPNQSSFVLIIQQTNKRIRLQYLDLLGWR